MKTYDAMVEEILRPGNVDIENFDILSEKKLSELFTEWQEREVDLMLIPEHEGQPAHVARVAIQVAVLVIDVVRGLQYLETKRVFGSGKVLQKKRQWTITETCRRGKEITSEAVRAVQDELGFSISADDLTVGKQLYPDPYDSSVYHGIKTYAMVQMFEWWTIKPWDDEVRIVQDTSKVLHIEAFPAQVFA